ncbi:Mss4-like protein [Lophiotrema nucula]|uniref:Mss4-like protein n=1 Tax=Lophiotrema nucula TaxID=690887 RepID=A0A6A5YPZ7_9PLEO|nr:Mss4-like protein [Lophiotrema nucula]
MADASHFEPLIGHCTCKAVQYQILAPPLVVNCCHCTYCQRETGTAFAINIMIETSYLKLTGQTQPEIIKTPSLSGKGQFIERCPSCHVAVNSHYGDSGTALSFVRAGTLVDGSRERVKPNCHIFTSTKVDWVDLKKEKERGVKVYDGYSTPSEVWSESSLERFKVFKEMLEEQKKREGK